MKNPKAKSLPKLLSRFRRTTPQTYIVPTRFGLIFFVVFILMVMVGATYQNNMIFVMAFLLFSFALIAMVQTHHNLDGLVIEHLFVDSGFAHGKGKVQFRLQSKKQRAYIATVYEGAGIRAFANVVESKKRNFVEGQVEYGDRGSYKVKRIKVKTVFPYGLFVAWQYHSVDTEYYVYPERRGSLELPTQEAHLGEDFSGHRKFTEKDSLRHVDWKAFARGRPLLIKEFRDGKNTVYMFDLEALQGDDVEKKLSQLSKWISDSHRRQNVFGLKVGSHVIPAAHGPEHLHRCLRELATYVA